MAVYEYLVDHARKNVWCTPDQDMQQIYKPAKLTGYRGVFNQLQIQWATITLPQTGARFHVYQIGQLHPLLLGLFPKSNQWIKISDVCNRMKMIIDLYSNQGVELPRTESWYLVMENRNLVIAVKEQPGIPFDQDTEELFFRVYSNAYFGSVRYDNNPTTDYIKIEGGRMGNQAAIMSLQQRFITQSSKPGLCYAFVNGFKVSGIDLFTTHVGDIAEIVYDSSIYMTKEFQISDINTFTSILDSKFKYLLHYPGVSENDIDYQDDIDFFIYQKDNAGRHRGVYYHRNQSDAVRMITHRDYAVPVAYVQGYAATRPEWPDAQQLFIGLHVRHGGWDRPLIFENSRIHELYKLTDVEIEGALIGVDATVDVWKAENLEAAGYTEIMRQSLLGVTETVVEKAYGYNAISKLLGDTPGFVEDLGNLKVVDLPYGLWTRSTGYEYDADGYMVGWSGHSNGPTYATTNVRTVLVEAITGVFDRLLDEVYGADTVGLDPTANYRMYTCPIVAGVPTNVFTDVTGSNKYHVSGNVLTWLVDKTKFLSMVRSDKIFLAYTLDLTSENGFIRFSLTTLQQRGGVVGQYVMQVPMGELTLWLNGKSLIEGIDYIVNFPEIVVINKQFLVDPDNTDQQIDIRFTGFCNGDLSRDPIDDVGFVVDGLLSKNNRFDIRDDKVLRITVAGKYYDRSELKFSETDSGVEVDEMNGSPYMITDVPVPFRGITDENTYSLRAKSKVIDKAVSDYMTLKMPEPVFTIPNPIPRLYEVYSPFCSAIIHDLKNGNLQDDRMIGIYGDSVVMDICQPYEYLLRYDPTQDGLTPDPKFVAVHPHDLYTTIDLQAFMYVFMEKVVRLYTKNRVDLTNFVRITDV